MRTERERPGILFVLWEEIYRLSHWWTWRRHVAYQRAFEARAHLARKRALEDELRQDLNILTDALPLEYLRSGLRIRHNHMTRVVKDPGLCPACDKYREER